MIKNQIIFLLSLLLFCLYLYKDRKRAKQTAYYYSRAGNTAQATEIDYMAAMERMESLQELLSIAEAKAERAKAKLIEDSKLKEAISQKHLDHDLKVYEQTQKQVISYRNQIATAERRAAKAVQSLQ